MLQIDAVVSAKLEEIRGRGRSQPMVFNRQLAMYFASSVGRWSTTVIGRFSNRDHLTVCYSIQEIEKLRLENPDIGALFTDLEQQLHEAHLRAQAVSNSPASNGPRLSQSPIELVARSAAEQFYRDFKNVLRRSIDRFQAGGPAGNPIPASLPSVDVHVPNQNDFPSTLPSK